MRKHTERLAANLATALEEVNAKLSAMSGALEKNEADVADVARDLKQVLDVLTSSAAGVAAPAPEAPAPAAAESTVEAAASSSATAPPAVDLAHEQQHQQHPPPQQQPSPVTSHWPTPGRHGTEPTIPAQTPPAPSIPAAAHAVGMPITPVTAPSPYGAHPTYPAGPPPAQAPPPHASNAPPSAGPAHPAPPMPQMPPLPVSIPQAMGAPDMGSHYGAGGPPPPPPPPSNMGGYPPSGMGLPPQLSAPGGMGPGYHPHAAHHAPVTGPPQRARNPAAPASLQNQSMKVSMEKVVDDFANMGFTRDQVRGVIRELTEAGQGVDLNVVLDRLMNGGVNTRRLR